MHKCTLIPFLIPIIADRKEKKSEWNFIKKYFLQCTTVLGYYKTYCETVEENLLSKTEPSNIETFRQFGALQPTRAKPSQFV